MEAFPSSERVPIVAGQPRSDEPDVINPWVRTRLSKVRNFISDAAQDVVSMKNDLQSLWRRLRGTYDDFETDMDEAWELHRWEVSMCVAALLLSASLPLLVLVQQLRGSQHKPSVTPWADAAAADLSPVVALWYNGECISRMADGAQLATDLSAQLVDGLAPDAILSIVLSALGLFLIARLGGIPVPTGVVGTALYALWMALLALQYVLVGMSLVMTARSLDALTYALEGCAHSAATVRWSVRLTLVAQPALLGPALLLFLYSYAFSTGLKVWSATQESARKLLSRESLVSQLKESVQSVPLVSAHYYVSYAAFLWACAVLLLTWPVAIFFLPAAALIAAAIKGIYWLAGVTDALIPPPAQTCGIEFGAGLTSWLKELSDVSFAPGGFSLSSSARSIERMGFLIIEFGSDSHARLGLSHRKEPDDPSLAALNLSLGVFWLLLSLALPVCFGTWLAIPLMLGSASLEAVASTMVSLGLAALDSLVSLLTLHWRWTDLLALDAMLAFLQAPVSALGQASGAMVGVGSLSYDELTVGASQLLVLNSVLALVKPLAMVLTKMMLVTPCFGSQVLEFAINLGANKLGARVSNANVIVKVDLESPAAHAGVLAGDLVLAVDDVECKGGLTAPKLWTDGAGRPNRKLRVHRQGETVLQTRFAAEAISFGDCVLSEVEGLLARLGAKPGHYGAIVLDCARTTLDEDDVAVLVLAIPMLRELTEINLSGSDMGTETVIALARAFSEGSNTKLAKLDVSGNRLEPAGAKALATFVGASSLREVSH